MLEFERAFGPRGDKALSGVLYPYGTTDNFRKDIVKTNFGKKAVSISGLFAVMAFNSIFITRVEAGSFVNVGSMATARSEHTATVLQNGEVLVAGGTSTGFNSDALTSAELYDPNQRNLDWRRFTQRRAHPAHGDAVA